MYNLDQIMPSLAQAEYRRRLRRTERNAHYRETLPAPSRGLPSVGLWLGDALIALGQLLKSSLPPASMPPQREG
jgi:hypothetical protein